MLRIEGADSRQTFPDLDVDGFSKAEVDYNLDLLIKEGLVNGTGQWSFGGRYDAAINGLSWAGHDFLDSVRDASIWQETKNKAEKAGHKAANLTLDVVMALATSVIREKLGI